MEAGTIRLIYLSPANILLHFLKAIWILPELRIVPIFFSSPTLTSSWVSSCRDSVGKQGERQFFLNMGAKTQLWLQLTLNQPHLKEGSKDSTLWLWSWRGKWDCPSCNKPQLCWHGHRNPPQTRLCAKAFAVSPKKQNDQAQLHWILQCMQKVFYNLVMAEKNISLQSEKRQVTHPSGESSQRNLHPKKPGVRCDLAETALAEIRKDFFQGCCTL